MQPKWHIGVAIERSSEYGRRFLQGLADYFNGKDDWRLDLLNPSLITAQNVRDYDGWICRITNRRTLHLLHGTGKPVVDAICLIPLKGFSSIRTDYTAIGTLAAEHFLAHRFANFAFCGYRHVNFSDLPRNAFVEFLANKGIRTIIYRPPYRPGEDNSSARLGKDLTEGPLGEARDADCLLTWLKCLPKPVAIFCCDDFRASTVARLCNTAGIVIPEEVAVLGVDNDPLYCMFGSPRLSSIDPDAQTIGFTAARMLHDRLALPGAPKVSVVTVPPKGIVMRASTDAYPGAPDWFADALAFIGGKYGEGLSASDVFRRVGFSRTLVERTFNRVIGRTVQQEIAEVRLQEAKRLLRTTSLSIKEIVAQTGYGSVEYFTRRFRAATGLPPATYRQRQGR